MKKILLLLMCTLLPRVVSAQGNPTDDTFTVSDLVWDDEISWNDDANTGAYYFTVSLSGNNTIYSACNLSITLPPGISVIYDEEEQEYLVRLNNTDKMFTNSHSLGCKKPNVAINVAIYSGTNKDFKKASGKLFNVYVTIDNAALTSNFSPKPIVKLSGLNLTTKEAVKYVPADFACRPFTTGIPTNRTLPVNISSTNKIGTLILPFDAALPSGLKAYSCNATVGDQLTLTPVESFEACMPYIVYAENGYSGNLSGTATLSDASNVTDVFTGGYLTGVLSRATVNTGYILQNQGNGPMFYDAEGVTFSLPAGRCYLTPPVASNVKSFGFNFDLVTSIKEELIKCEESKCQLRDLSGRQVVSPTRGIYIQGTRKVVIK